MWDRTLSVVGEGTGAGLVFPRLPVPPRFRLTGVPPEDLKKKKVKSRNC